MENTNVKRAAYGTMRWRGARGARELECGMRGARLPMYIESMHVLMGMLGAI